MSGTYVNLDGYTGTRQELGKKFSERLLTSIYVGTHTFNFDYTLIRISSLISTCVRLYYKGRYPKCSPSNAGRYI